MPKNIPSLKPRELIRLLEQGGCTFYREGKGDHRLYVRESEDSRRVVPIDMGAREMSPAMYCEFFDNLGLLMKRLKTYCSSKQYLKAVTDGDRTSSVSYFPSPVSLSLNKQEQ